MSDGRAGGTADSTADGGAPQYWFNPRTREVEEGMVSPWSDRMGPYPTREAAERALETAEGRTDAWDEEDRRWREG
ncbi:hypothetical protein [Cellulomonas carbonis]|nr:hypothetical protein [Cellulomonas carbonis]